MSIIEDRFLLWKLRNGYGDALRRVYEKYKGPMVSVAMAMTGDMSVAEDAMQDAFVSFAGKAAAGAVRSNMRAYLMTSVVNNVRRRIRQRRPVGEWTMEGIDLPIVEESVPEKISQAEDIERLKAAMARLPEEQREVISLRIHGGLSFDDVATAQDSNPNTARTRYRRGIENLRELMNGKVEVTGNG